MAKMNNHASRFLKSMEENGKLELAKQFLKDNPLNESADINKKFDWAQKQCEFLSKHLNDKTILG